MAPMKFEENIRERLEQREIKPSVKAWERIERDLDASAKRKNKKGYSWLIMAAGFTGVLILAGLVFFKTEMPNAPQVVINPNVENSVEKNTVEEVKKPDVKQVESGEIQIARSEEMAKPTSDKQKIIRPQGQVEQKSSVAESASQNIKIEEPVQKYIDEEVNALLAKATEQQKTGVAYSDLEIEKLLRDAQRDIITEKLFKNAQNSVNAEALLYEVEEELDPSFRDRIFEALKDGFLKAREAVVSRNN